MPDRAAHPKVDDEDVSDPASLSASANVASPRGIDERASASPPAGVSAPLPLSRLWSEPDASFRSSTRRESFCSFGRCIAISERSAFSKCSLVDSTRTMTVPLLLWLSKIDRSEREGDPLATECIWHFTNRATYFSLSPILAQLCLHVAV